MARQIHSAEVVFDQPKPGGIRTRSGVHRLPAGADLPGLRSLGFTLIEVLIAAVLFMALLIIVSNLADQTARLTGISNRKIQSDSENRQILDRLSMDFAQALQRNDLPPRFEKAPGNDKLFFHAETESYTGDRQISIVGYQLKDGILKRGVEGYSWSGNQVSSIPFGSLIATEPIADSNYEVLSENVFRFEMAFFMKDGTFQSDAPASWGEVKAVLVGIASLDEASKKKFNGDLSQLAALLPDYDPTSAGTEDLLTQWNKILGQPGFYESTNGYPATVLKGIRILQRYFILKPPGFVEE